MSLTSAFFDAELVGGVYDRVYSAERFAEYFAAFIANGVFPDPATNLQVVANVPRDMTVLVKSGLGWINGYYCNNDGNYPLTISPASGTLPRVDAVVLRWSRSNRSISLEVKTGVATSSPSAPSLERSADNYELMLASIEVVAGATSIAQANITDKRPDSSVCGWVKGVVDQVDTTNLFAQYDAAFQEWFDNIKSQLSGDIATNLQNQIDRNAANIATINATTLKEDTKAALGLPTSAGPDDAFKVLTHVGNLHMWQRVQTYADPVPEVPAGYTLGEVETDVLLVSVTSNPGNQSKSVLLYYDSSLNVTNDGIISVSSSNYVYANVTNMNAVNRIVGQFVSVETIGTAVEKTDLKEGEIYYVPEDCEISYSLLESPLYIRLSKVQRVTGYPYTPAIPAGTHVDYLTSTDENAYTEGTVDRTTITYLGQLGGGARIEVGSYVGTGTYGSSNPNTLTFEFEPKMVIIAPKHTKNWFYGFALTYQGALWVQGEEKVMTNYASSSSDMENSTVVMTLSGKTLMWYSTYNDTKQLNDSGRTFIVVAIC